MKKSELRQIIKEEIEKALNKTNDEVFFELKKEYYDGSEYDKMIKDERYLSLPRDLQTKLKTIIQNQIRQNYY
jgi:hypothetical protein